MNKDMKIWAEEIGARLRLARNAVGLSQAEVAAKMGIGQNLLSGYEMGKNVPRLNVLLKLANLLEISLIDLIAQPYSPLNSPPKTFSERLYWLRTHYKESRLETAAKLNVEAGVYAKWELGVQTPSIAQLVKFAEVYGVSLDWLLKGGGETNDLP